MNWLWLGLAVAGGILIGIALGSAWAAQEMERREKVAANIALATVAVTAELTYGEQWLEEFIDECDMVMELHPDLVEDKVKEMTVKQIVAERIAKLKEKK